MPNENLQIHTNPSGESGVTVMALVGSLNIHTIFSFQSATRADSSPKLVIDFSGVGYVD